MSAAQSRRDDRGDTLIELLITLIIVSLAIVALLGGLLTSTSISATHRNISNLDSILRSVAETTRYEIETKASFGPSSGPQFQQCASPSQYKVVSNTYPQNGAVGTAVTVFTLGLTSPWTVTVGNQPATIVGSPVGDASGTNLTFVVPTLASSQAYPVIVNGVQAATQFAVNTTTATPASPLAGYTFTTSMTYWDGSGFTWDQATCQTTPAAESAFTRLQQLTMRLAETETNNAASDSFKVTLADFKPLAVPTVTVTPPGPYPLGSPVPMAAAVAGVAGVPTPTGSIAWVVPSGMSTTGCTTSLPAPSCTISHAGAGSYYAQYSGDANYIGGQSNVVTVQQASPVITVALTNPPAPTTPVAPASLTYVATFNGAVAGFAPTGKIAFSGPCAGTVALTPGSPPTATCTQSGVAGGSYTETATYQPGTDPNYTAGTAGTTTTTVLYPTSTTVSVTSSSPGAPATLTFTATVAGSGPNIAAAPAAVTWSAGCTAMTPLTSSVPYTSTCTVTAATPGTYSETATYTGNAQNSGSSGSNTEALQLPSSVSVTGTPTITGQPATTRKITFQATVSGSAGTPTGTVTWSVATKTGNTPGTATCTISSTTLTNGQASCEIDSPTKNVTYTATANYGGDTTYAPSSGTSPGVKA